MSMETWVVNLAWRQISSLGVGENYVCCLVIVVIFMGHAAAKMLGDLKSSYGEKLKEMGQFLRRSLRLS